jgi:hypothetical protein
VRTVLSRTQIKTVKDRKIEFVPVPEWTDNHDPEAGVFVMGLTGTARDEFELSMIDQKKGRLQSVNMQNLRARLIVLTAVDSDNLETARTIFSAEDITWLGKKSAQALQRVYAMAQKLSGLSNEDVEELTKELGEDLSDGSGTDSLLLLDTAPSQSVKPTSPVTNSPSGWPTTGLNQSEIGD